MATKENQVIEVSKTEVLPPDITERINEAKKQNEALMALMRGLLKDGVDYGTVPGVPKPFLQQPGAQQLGLVFKFRAEFEKIDSIIDFNQEPVFIAYEYKCKIYHRENGIFMGEGVGACNNYEKKYKYHKDGIVFADPLDRQNTLVKMAKKRSYVDAMLNVTGASRLFTQDPDGLDDIDEQYTQGKGIEPGEYKMPFGKHKGVKLKNLDDNYLKWLLEKMEAKSKSGEMVKEMARKFLADGREEKSGTGDADIKSDKAVSNENGNNQTENNLNNVNRIKELNEIIKSHNGLWDVVKDFVKNETGSNAINKVNDISDNQWDNLKITINNMIPEEEPEGPPDDLYNDDFDVPF